MNKRDIDLTLLARAALEAIKRDQEGSNEENTDNHL